jgi:hypothetical protein
MAHHACSQPVGLSFPRAWIGNSMLLQFAQSGSENRLRRSGLVIYALQPGCFEGGRPVLVIKDVDDLVVLHLDLGVEANVDLDPAGLTPAR